MMYNCSTTQKQHAGKPTGRQQCQLHVGLVLKLLVVAVLHRGCSSQPCGVGTLYLNNCNYTSFPTAQIIARSSPPATTLYVMHNNISSINSTVDFAGLNKTAMLIMSYNLFTAFPDFQYIGSTLSNLQLDNNPIATVDPTRLTPLVALKVLSLTFTLLTAFPDAYMPSLINLNLRNTLLTQIPSLPILGKRVNIFSYSTIKISSIDRQALATYTNVTQFSISLNTNLTSFPNFCTLPSNANAQFMMGGSHWACDCRLRWMRYRADINFNITDLTTCYSPASVAGKVLLSLPLSNFTCAGKTFHLYKLNVQLA